MAQAVRLDEAALERAVYRRVRPVIAEIVEQGAIGGRVEAPAVTYELRSSVAGEVSGTSLSTLAGYVVARARHAAYVYKGTRPHIIRPRRAKVLRFRTDSGVVYARQVRHPGTRPNPWLSKAVRDAIRRVLR